VTEKSAEIWTNYTSSECTNLRKAFLAISHTELDAMFIYCEYRFVVTRVVAMHIAEQFLSLNFTKNNKNKTLYTLK